MRTFALAACLLLPGCGENSASSGSPSTAIASPTFKVGDLSKDGRLIFWSIEAVDGNIRPFVLHDDEYGVVLYNDGTEDKPVAHYIFACQSTRQIVHTGDFAIWQQAVAKIPRGSTVGSYDTCSVPRSYGLPEAAIQQG